jgi:HPt (histidine-containing phosphotransfer) domain-containing protein
VVDDNISLVEWSVFSRARAELGANFVRILGYFDEDGVKSVSAIEEAMRASNAAALVIPAHTLKGESRQFGAEPLADCAETIEMIARSCVETHDTPDQALEHVVRLRPLFQQTLAALEREANPLVQHRQSGFGRRAASGFGKA